MVRGFGYRYGEVPLPKILEIKEGVTITAPKPSSGLRRPVVKVDLGPHVRGAALPHADPADPGTMEAGVRKRSAFKAPRPDTLRLERLRCFVRKWVRHNLVPLAPDTDLSVESWLRECSYPQTRKEELWQKWLRLKSIKDPSKKYKLCKGFMKDESYIDWKHARGINSRSDEFKCFVGPIFKRIEEILYKDHHFIKHVPVADRPQYIRDLLYKVGAKYISTDYTAFESLFIAELMDCCEFELYDYMTEFLPNHDDFMGTIRAVLAGVNTSEFKFFTFSVPATRMSGEMNTSLGNGFSNLMFMLFLCEELGSTVDGVVEGDDGEFRVDGPIPTSKDFESLGLVIKLEEHDDLCTASFCGLIFDPEELINITEPLKALCNFGWTTNNYYKAKRSTKMALLKAKSLSYAHQYPGCPIISRLAMYGLRMTRSVSPRHLRHFVAEKWRTSLFIREETLKALAYFEDNSFNVPHKETGLRTRMLMERKFGITVEVQLSIESYLNGKDDLSPIDHPLMDLLAPRAWQDYYAVYCLKGIDPSEERAMWVEYDGFTREW